MNERRQQVFFNIVIDYKISFLPGYLVSASTIKWAGSQSVKKRKQAVRMALNNEKMAKLKGINKIRCFQVDKEGFVVRDDENLSVFMCLYYQVQLNALSMKQNSHPL